ncbi:sigma-70 family RNA polymerase sigma factor [Carnobacterium maltaromaticum]|uniref:sigma-70 family RNA polymerase sigma factor n=1 Tax=Carnobacterium maltaromaticum TaxID=2751 RepID=UPI00165BC197|nr:sigma-70 family RNA polymerase sigma factor [Carnobacterium maltaromaticum]MBC9810722.1 sigma-70 family RNA polymerase sigma factor [Carnobacterium maltaromaticum]
MCTKKTLNNIFINYIHQVTKKTALAYFRKKYIYQNRTLLCVSLHDYLVPYYEHTFFFDYLLPENVNEMEQYTVNDSLSFALSKLSNKEKVFIFEKYILCKTDKEIALNLGISRQGVSIFKKRILTKLHHYLKSS